MIPDSQVTRTTGGKQKRCLLIYAQHFSNNMREQLLQHVTHFEKGPRQCTLLVIYIDKFIAESSEHQHRSFSSRVVAMLY